MPYVTEKQIEEIAESLLIHFEFGLHSDSPVKDIIPYVLDELSERNFPTRRSLASVIAKVVKLKWRERALNVKAILEG